MLKDITLGQYFPGNTPVHRLDPRTKLLALILYIVTIFTTGKLLPGSGVQPADFGFVLLKNQRMRIRRRLLSPRRGGGGW